MFADEPTGSSTPSVERSPRVVSGLCREREIAVLLVTHDPQAAAYADRVHTLRDGGVDDGEADDPVGAGETAVTRQAGARMRPPGSCICTGSGYGPGSSKKRSPLPGSRSGSHCCSPRRWLNQPEGSVGGSRVACRPVAANSRQGGQRVPRNPVRWTFRALPGVRSAAPVLQEPANVSARMGPSR